MGRYIIRRLIQALPLLFFLSVAMFGMIHAMPGGPEQVIFNPRMDAAAREAMRERFGLNDPLPIQYLKWVGNSLTGDFGFSFKTNRPVSDILAQRFPATLQLFVGALALALVMAVFLGVISALRQNTIVDYGLTIVSYFGLAMPAFILGLFLQDIFGVQLHILPVSGMDDPRYVFDAFNGFLDRVTHMILPTLALATLFVAGWSRFMRASMVDVVKQDYIRTARAKGLSTSAIMIRHAIRNAVIPLITVVAIGFGAVAGGATITEGVFSWPGMGSQFLASLLDRDYPVLLAMLVLSSFFVVIFNLVADILYGVMDPRIRFD